MPHDETIPADLATAPDTAPAPAPAPPSLPAPAAAVAQQNTSERQIIVRATALTVSLCILAITGSLCFVVVHDGNGSLVSDVTTKLTLVAGLAILSMVAALFGQNSVLGKLIDKLS